MGLYKDRYLIAVYDKEDHLLDCVTSLKDVGFLSKDTIYSEVSRNAFFNNVHCGKYRVFLIDCLEEHDDCFKEEDEIFLEQEKRYSTKKSVYAKLAEKYGVNIRTIQRWVCDRKKNIINEVKGEMGDVI